MLHRQPRVFPLTGSVGHCGTNHPEDVRKIQSMINNAGYYLATGRTVIVNGKCTAQTNDAILWYQRLLALSPSGLVYPTDGWFIKALNEVSSHWRPKHTAGSLRVSEGQITFDAEGVDYITAVEPFRQRNYPNFSRILQWPPKFASGVTLGRGYDMGNRSAGEIYSTLRQAGIEEYKAVICSKASHLKGREAGQFVKVYGPLVGEITHHQQIKLFYIAYKEKLDYGKGVYYRQSRHVPNALPWNRVDEEIREVFIDTLYQGNVTASEMVKIMASNGSREQIISYLRNDFMLSGDPRRNKIRIKALNNG